MVSVIRYNICSYLRSNRFVLPLLVFVCYFPFAYTILPVGILSGYTLSACMVYFVMVWIGASFGQSEPVVMEQLVRLKVRKGWHMAAGRFAFIALASLLLALVSFLFPLLYGAAIGTWVFTRSMYCADIVVIVGEHLLFGFLGGMAGLTITRLITSRKLMLLAVPLFSAMGLLRQALEADFPLSVCVTWIFPPVHYMTGLMANMELVDINTCIRPFSALVLYGAAEVLLYYLVFRYRLD